jgi:hypothetical protein
MWSTIRKGRLVTVQMSSFRHSNNNNNNAEHMCAIINDHRVHLQGKWNAEQISRITIYSGSFVAEKQIRKG